MFTYVCLGTSDPERAARFYDAVLGTLGHRRCEAGADWEAAGWRGWGTYERNGISELALWLCLPFDGRAASAGNGTMVAFSARSAYVRDPDGNKLAAVCRGFTGPQAR